MNYIDIHLIAQNPMSIHIREWDVRTVYGGTFLGVIEEFDNGYTYTDETGNQFEFVDGENLTDIRDWVSDVLNLSTRH